jgi:hypothetical protein
MVPSLQDSLLLYVPTQGFRPGLSHTAPSGLSLYLSETQRSPGKS